MLWTYLDDSGHHADSPYCIVAGYWGSANEWGKFEREWQNVLDLEGIDEFHAVELWNARRSFENWSDEKKRELVSRLLGIIETRKIYPVACEVNVKDWEDLSPIEKRWISRTENEKQHTPTHMSLMRTVLRSAQYCHRDLKMNYLFDKSQSKINSVIENVFNDVIEDIKSIDSLLVNRIGTFSFKNSKESPPLQAADLIAYEVQKWSKQIANGTRTEQDAYRNEFSRAFGRYKSEGDFEIYDKSNLSFIGKRHILPTFRRGG